MDETTGKTQQFTWMDLLECSSKIQDFEVFECVCCKIFILYPIGSMYGIFTHIYHKKINHSYR